MSITPWIDALVLRGFRADPQRPGILANKDITSRFDGSWIVLTKYPTSATGLWKPVNAGLRLDLPLHAIPPENVGQLLDWGLGHIPRSPDVNGPNTNIREDTFKSWLQSEASIRVGEEIRAIEFLNGSAFSVTFCDLPAGMPRRNALMKHLLNEANETCRMVKFSCVGKSCVAAIDFDGFPAETMSEALGACSMDALRAGVNWLLPSLQLLANETVPLRLVDELAESTATP